MAGDLQPLDEKFSIVGPDGRPSIYFIKWAQQRQIDIGEATTADEVTEIVATYIVDHPAEWGDIVGILSDQTDLQTALDAKLGFTFDGYQTNIDVDFLVVRNVVTGAGAGTGSDDTIGYFNLFGAPGSGLYAFFGSLNGNSRIYAIGSNAFEFNLTPYVNSDVVFHAGNLVFGAGLDYTAGVLTTTGGGGAVLPVVDGSIPPVFLQNPDGSLIYAPI